MRSKSGATASCIFSSTDNSITIMILNQFKLRYLLAAARNWVLATSGLRKEWLN